MDEAVHSLLAAWESFYIVVGSSAGALTGLQFVVIALIAGSNAPRTPPEIAAFGTPIVVHSAPALWQIAAATLLLVFVGIHNAWDAVTYIAVNYRRERDETGRAGRRR